MPLSKKARMTSDEKNSISTSDVPRSSPIPIPKLRRGGKPKARDREKFGTKKATRAAIRDLLEAEMPAHSPVLSPGSTGVVYSIVGRPVAMQSIDEAESAMDERVSVNASPAVSVPQDREMLIDMLTKAKKQYVEEVGEHSNNETFKKLNTWFDNVNSGKITKAELIAEAKAYKVERSSWFPTNSWFPSVARFTGAPVIESLLKSLESSQQDSKVANVLLKRPK